MTWASAILGNKPTKMVLEIMIPVTMIIVKLIINKIFKTYPKRVLNGIFLLNSFFVKVQIHLQFKIRWMTTIPKITKPVISWKANPAKLVLNRVNNNTPIPTSSNSLIQFIFIYAPCVFNTRIVYEEIVTSMCQISNESVFFIIKKRSPK